MNFAVGYEAGTWMRDLPCCGTYCWLILHFMAGIRKFLIATSNPGKFHEIYNILQDLPSQFFSSKDLGLSDHFEEIGETHQEVALNKAKFYYEQTASLGPGFGGVVRAGGFGAGSSHSARISDLTGPILTLAEDSGIIVDALRGELGVKTRRWGAGEHATDQEWIEYFLNAMKDVPESERTARFICCAVLIDEQGASNLFIGQTEGIITLGLEAPIKAGLPLSSCFRPIGFDKVYAAMTSEEKAKVSHRGQAITKVREFLLAG